MTPCVRCKNLLRTEIVNLGTESTTERSVGLLDSLDNINLFLSKVFFRSTKRLTKKHSRVNIIKNMIERLVGFIDFDFHDQLLINSLEGYSTSSFNDSHLIISWVKCYKYEKMEEWT